MEIDRSRKVESSRCACEARMIARDSVTPAYGKMSALWPGSLAAVDADRKTCLVRGRLFTACNVLKQTF